MMTKRRDSFSKGDFFDEQYEKAKAFDEKRLKSVQKSRASQLMRQ